MYPLGLDNPLSPFTCGPSPDPTASLLAPAAPVATPPAAPAPVAEAAAPPTLFDSPAFAGALAVRDCGWLTGRRAAGMQG